MASSKPPAVALPNQIADVFGVVGAAVHHRQKNVNDTAATRQNANALKIDVLLFLLFRYAARTIPYVMRLLFVVLFNFFFSMSATSHFLLNVLTKNTGRFHNQNYDQNTEYNGISHL